MAAAPLTSAPLTSARLGSPAMGPPAVDMLCRRPGGAGLDVHARLAALVRGQAPLRRALVRLAARFVALRGWERLGFVRLRDWAVERVGLSARTLQDLARMDAAFAELPQLEAAFVRGELSWAKARLLARVALPDDEARWVELARRLRVRALEREVRAVDVGSLEAGAGAEAGEVETAGEEPRPHGVAWVRPDAARVGPPVRPRADSWRARLRVASPGASGPEANGCAARRDPGSAMPDLPPEIAELLAGVDECDAFELDARLRRAVALEQRFEARAGPLLLAVAEGRLYRERGYAKLEDYARDVLGISPRKARALVRLERACGRAPALGTAYRDGLLSWVQAQALVPLARLPEAPLEGWIGWADRVTVRRLEEDVERALIEHEQGPRRGIPLPHDAGAPAPSPAQRQTGAQATVSGAEISVDAANGAGAATPAEAPGSEDPEPPSEPARLFWSAPKPAARFFRAVLCSVRRWIERGTGRLPTSGEAFEAMLDHALETWWGTEARLGRAHPVIERDGFRCTAPGCSSYRNLHDHHVRFRSKSGSNALANRTTLCIAHHLRGVHAGRVRITGNAPEGLRFELGVRPDGPPLEVYRSGDVRAVST